MASSAHDTQRPVLLGAVRALIAEARAERAVLAMDAPERRFFLGVEAAAEEVLHPELAHARSEDWPRREPVEFQEGYLQTAMLVAAALSAPEPPLRLALAQPR